MIGILLKIVRERRSIRSKNVDESSSGKEQVTFESTDYDTELSPANKSQKHEEWFNKDADKDYNWFDDSNEHDWFNELVGVGKDPKKGEIIQDESTVMFAKCLKKCLNINKLTKEDLRRSKEMDWVNPKSSINKEQEQFSDLSKPLPLVGPRFNQQIPISHFFNKDLEYLMHGNKEKKYLLSLTKRPAAVYNLNGIEEETSRLFKSSVDAYDEDAELGIHH
ncbi:hypothetical protein Tco_0774635 [Tanacetum coccineum]|uniref:Uncharacterized protein n=1 Tax=Tanacetum coccineum TaxID=301880 RepID=A0ABQ4ZP13_9ASTR